MVLACALAAGIAVTSCEPKVDQVLAARDQVDSLAAHVLSDFERHPEFSLERGVALESRRRHIGLARDLEGAWVAEEIACRVDDPADPRAFLLRYSGIAARTDSGWKFLYLHYSRPLELGTAVRLAAADSLHVPFVMAGATPGRREREVLKQFERALADTGRWMRAFSRREDLSFIGPEASAYGRIPARTMLRRELATAPWRRDYSAVLAGRAGRVGWVVTNLVRTVESEAGPVEIPYRALLVFHRRGENWNLVHAHLSNGNVDTR